MAHSAEARQSTEAELQRPKLELVDKRAEAHEAEGALEARGEAAEGVADQLGKELEKVGGLDAMGEYTGEVKKISAELVARSEAFQAEKRKLKAQILAELRAKKPEDAKIKEENFVNGSVEVEAGMGAYARVDKPDAVEKALDAVKDNSEKDLSRDTSAELISQKDIEHTKKSLMAELKKSNVDAETIKVAGSLFDEVSSPYATAESVAGTMAILSVRGLDNGQMNKLADFLRQAAPNLAPSEKDFDDAMKRIGTEGLSAEAEEAKEGSKAPEKKRWNNFFDKLSNIANNAKKNPKFAYADSEGLNRAGKIAIAEAILNGEYTQQEVEDAAKKYNPDFFGKYMPSDEDFADAMVPVAEKDRETSAKAKAKGDKRYEKDWKDAHRKNAKIDAKITEAENNAKAAADKKSATEAAFKKRLEDEEAKAAADREATRNKVKAAAEKEERAAKAKLQKEQDLAKIVSEGKAKIEADKIRIAGEKSALEAGKKAKEAKAAADKKSTAESAFKKRMDDEEAKAVKGREAARKKIEDATEREERAAKAKTEATWKKVDQKRNAEEQKKWDTIIDKFDVAFNSTVGPKIPRGEQGKAASMTEAQKEKIFAPGREAAAKILAETGYSLSDLKSAIAKYRENGTRFNEMMPSETELETVKQKMIAEKSKPKKPGFLNKLSSFFGGKK